jgi:hypothetical protein
MLEKVSSHLVLKTAAGWGVLRYDRFEKNLIPICSSVVNPVRKGGVLNPTFNKE